MSRISKVYWCLICCGAVLLGAAGQPIAAAQETPSPAKKPSSPPAKIIDAQPPKASVVLEHDPKPITGLTEHQTESGVKYWDFKVGDGEPPEPHGLIKIRITGWNHSGKMFSTNIQRKYIRPFAIDKIRPPGLRDGIMSMKTGGERRLETPPNLGYPENAHPKNVPALSPLVFEVELLAVISRPKQSPYKNLEANFTPSGVKYWDLVEGSGDSPHLDDTITVNFTGWLPNGAVFDSSIEHGRPAKIRLDTKFTGLREGIETMQLGGKRRLEVPYQLAYGEAGYPPLMIPPKTDIIYEVELLAIRPPLAPADVTHRQTLTTKKSGLKYWVLKKGDGVMPEPDSRIILHYSNWLTDGTLVETSHSTGHPLVRVKSQLLPGIAEAVWSMKEHDVWQVELTPAMAYGEEGKPPRIPANATIISKIELLKVLDDKATEAALAKYKAEQAAKKAKNGG